MKNWEYEEKTIAPRNYQKITKLATYINSRILLLYKKFQYK